jgi:TonB family protein
LFCAILLFATAPQTKDRPVAAPQPDQFEIGRRTFWDFGPPFNYYDLFVVRPSGQGSAIERIILTPVANECLAPAKFEHASASMDVSPAELLGSVNACAIPEKELKRKPKDCKHCARFSGADVAIRVRCGTEIRVIPSHIFEDYWFNSAAKPPKTTSSMLELLKRLDYAVGPGVIDKPAFSLPDDGNQNAKPPETNVLQQLGQGEFDGLFKAGPDKPSEIYRSAQVSLPTPIVQLLTIVPIEPEVAVIPNYPRLARVANIQGEVTFGGEVNLDGTLTNIVFVNGDRVLQAAVGEALQSWKFARDTYGQQIRATIGFQLSCYVLKP